MVPRWKVGPVWPRCPGLSQPIRQSKTENLPAQLPRPLGGFWQGKNATTSNLQWQREEQEENLRAQEGKKNSFLFLPLPVYLASGSQNSW